MKKIVLLALAAMMTLGMSAQEGRELHILSTNDMHAAIECMPRLGFVADSLRALYPDLLILSAGDNRSGEPLNDMYEITAYPMVALMNLVGFKATTLGNHEFDSGQEGLAKLIDMSAFSTLCANVHPVEKWNMHVKPYQIYDCGGLTVGVIGAVALGKLGIPESHPAKCTDIKFSEPLEAIQGLRWLREKCDVIVLLSHLGYSLDVEFSKQLPWVDIIVGGHSHTQLKGGEVHNGVFITQNTNRLKRATHSTIIVEDGKVVKRMAENIEIRGQKNENKVVAALVRHFSENPAFLRVLAQVDTPFENYEELGCMMCDAYMIEGQCDLSFQNAGGVRYETHDVGGFTVSDVLRLDPFQNEAVEMKLTGKELADVLVMCYNNDGHQFPYVAGMTAEYTIDPANKEIKKLVLLDKDGKKLNPKKIYKVMTNSYSAAITPTNRKDAGAGIGKITAQLIMDYLEHQGHVSYQGVKRLTKKSLTNNQ
jgi:5'-nucleotidase